MKTRHTCIIGDSRKMSEITDSSVHLIITSPPYWQIKDYGVKAQIGFHDSYETYINHLNLVWKECGRVLHPGCRMVINVGDQFARAAYYGRYKIVPIRSEIIRFCETIGFDYMGAIIWQKKTTMNTTGGATVMGSYPFPRNGMIEIDYEFILIFRKAGKPPKVSPEIKEKSRLGKEQWKEYFSGHWQFEGARQDKHLAMFPLELPKRIIEMFSFAGETVLDPFLGSGTTSLAAMTMNRNSIGYEINNDFLPLIMEKLGTDDIFGNYETEYVKQAVIHRDWQSDLAALPYLFHDPVKCDKNIGPDHSFGSKTSADNIGIRREEYYTVREIIRADKIRLSDNRIVRLIGIIPKPESEMQAKEFLAKKILKRQVFLRFEENQQDTDDCISAYVYMKNKTFINAHLIKHKLANADPQCPKLIRAARIDIRQD